MGCFISKSDDVINNDHNNANDDLHNFIQDDEYKWSNTKIFVPPITKGHVIKVYDGDTITIATKLPIINDTQIYRFSVRLNNIDTPEIKGKSNQEKEAAIIARDALKNMILNKEVYLKNISLEKYGRLLADVYLNDLYLNNWMLENKYAVEYHGKTKQVFKPTSL